jgi:hypothetical protein
MTYRLPVEAVEDKWNVLVEYASKPNPEVEGKGIEMHVLIFDSTEESRAELGRLLRRKKGDPEYNFNEGNRKAINKKLKEAGKTNLPTQNVSFEDCADLVRVLKAAREEGTLKSE